MLKYVSSSEWKLEEIFFSTNYSESVISDYYIRGQFDGGGKPGPFPVV